MKAALPILLLFLCATAALGGEPQPWSFERRQDLSPVAMRRFGITEAKDRRHTRELKLLNYEAGLNLLGDCGNLDFKASAKSIYDEGKRLFSDLRDAAIGSAQGSMGAAPMLALCYFSPTGCSIAKNLQLYASYRAKLKFDQCRAINGFIDGQSEAYKEGEARCLRTEMAKTGDVASAVDHCQGSAGRLVSWVDGASPGGNGQNAIVKSSAKWAGLDDKDGQFLEAILGGVEYDSSGVRHVGFGSMNPLTPARLMDTYAKTAFTRLCGDAGVLDSFKSNGRLTDDDSKYFTSRGREILDVRLLGALASLPAGEQAAACDRLSSSLALTRFTDEVTDRLDQLYIMTQNPNLPPDAVATLEGKAQRLSAATNALVHLRDLRHEGLNETRSDILTAGADVQRHRLSRTAVTGSAKQGAATTFTECEDFTVCVHQAR